MNEPVPGRWVGEAYVFVLGDETGLVGPRRTRCVLTRSELRLRGVRLGGLNTAIPLDRVVDVSVRLHPVPFTLVIRTRSGVVEVPCGAHDPVSVEVIADRIRDAAAQCAEVARDGDTAEAAEARAALERLLGRRLQDD